MKKFSIILFALLFGVQPFAHSQIIDNVKNDFFHALNTGGGLATSFFRFDETTQLDFAGSLIAVGAGYSVDNTIQKFSQNNISSFNDKLFSVDKVYGSGYTLIAIAGIYGYGLFLNDPGVRKIGLQTIEAVGYAGLITSILKSVVGRSRPYTNEGKANFHPFNTHASQTSFPSGHSTVVFAVSTVLANNTDNVFLKILCYTAAGLVGCSRLYHNAHWFSDVIAGGAIGYFVGDYVSANFEKAKTNNSGVSFNFSGSSIEFSYSF
ncbi:MAG: phosphatase PAP2 family protein [Ignavibacteriaceae bacterium]